MRRRQRDRGDTGKRESYDVARTILLRLGVIVLLIAALVEVMRFRERRCPGCNVILISADTLRADHLGCHGYWRETSPAIDRLARQSLLFANAYSASAWTLPGHMTMLTGRYAVRESEFVFMSGQPFPADYVSLPQVLQRAGYATAGFVGGGFVGDGMGFGRGFDTYSMRPERLRAREDTVGSWLSRRDPRRPFFLFLHGYDVHEPYAPPEEFRLRFIDEVPVECRGVDLRCNQADLDCRRSPRGREYLVSQYDAAILGIDRFVGWLMGELKRRRLDTRTIVAFTADHGENLMENGDLTCGHMGSLDEPVFRVPLIIHLPGAQPRRVDSRVSLVDLAPTLLHLLGIPRPDSMHGASLVPLLEGETRERQINGLTGNDPGNVVLATITGHEKVIKWRWRSGSPWIYELYDLARDPQANNNLFPETGPPPLAFYTALHRLESWVGAIGLELDGAEQAPRRSLPPAALDQLEALGYR